MKLFPFWMFYMIHFIFNSTRQSPSPGQLFFSWHAERTKERSRMIWVWRTWGCAALSRSGWLNTKQKPKPWHGRSSSLARQMSFVWGNLFVVIPRMSQSHGWPLPSCLRTEWQIIWLFIMNCHVSQGNYINYPTEIFVMFAFIRVRRETSDFTSCFKALILSGGGERLCGGVGTGPGLGIIKQRRDDGSNIASGARGGIKGFFVIEKNK